MPNGMIATLDQFTAEDREEMLLAAVEQENKKNTSAQIYVVDFNDLEDHLNTHDTNHQIIVNYMSHYTAVDVRKIEGEKLCIVLDSAMDPRGASVVEELQKSGFDVYFASAFKENSQVGIQFDLFSCSMFAFDHCVQFSYSQDVLYHQLQTQRESRTDHVTYWSDFPPNFLWNAQSLSKVLGPYEKMIEEKSPELLQQLMPNGLSYHTYIGQGRSIVQVEEDGKVHEVVRNNAINIHVFSKVHELYQQRKKEQYSIYKQMSTDIQRIEALSSASLADRKAIIEKLKDIQSDFAASSLKTEPRISPLIIQFKDIVSKCLLSCSTENEATAMMKSRLTKLTNRDAETHVTESVDSAVVNDAAPLKGYSND